MLLALAELEKLQAQAEALKPQQVSYERQPAKPREVAPVGWTVGSEKLVMLGIL